MFLSLFISENKKLTYLTSIYPILPDFIQNYCILRETFSNAQTCIQSQKWTN